MKRFFLLSKAKQIAIIVIFSHFCVVLALCFHHLFTRGSPKKKMVVRSVSLPPSARAPFVDIQKSVDSTSSHTNPKLQKKSNVNTQKKNIASTSKKEAKKELEKKVPIVTSKIQKEKDLAASLLQEIDGAIAELKRSENSLHSASKQSSLDLPKEVPSMISLISNETDDASYGERLIAFLQACLVLPEFGDVKVDLKMNSSGQLISFKILESKSQKNEDFLKKRLPELKLPCFNEPGDSQVAREFTIIFKNASVL